MLGNNKTSVWDFQKDDLMFVQTLLLMDTPKIILTIWLIYLIFILKLGPQMMKNRPAYNLNKVLTIYNAVQVVLSGYIVYSGTPLLWKYGLKPKCMDNTDDKIGYVRTFHFYYLLKVVELLDTVFFILRKKYNQASFLHVYHHSYMVVSTWFIVRYDPSYATLFPGVLNSFIHVIMYTYYGLSAFPSLAKYLWWKKHITSMQLIQFVMIISHFFRSYHTSKCPPTFLTAYSMIANCSLFIILFSNFYIKSYRKPKKDRVGEARNGIANCRTFDDKNDAAEDALIKGQNCKTNGILKTGNGVKSILKCEIDKCKVNGVVECSKKIL